MKTSNSWTTKSQAKKNQVRGLVSFIADLHNILEPIMPTDFMAHKQSISIRGYSL